MCSWMEHEYNGWTNYETWVIKLWIDNDEYPSQYWREQAANCKDACKLSKQLKAEYEAEAPDLTGVYADLLQSAIDGANWYEIAESLIYECENG